MGWPMKSSVILMQTFKSCIIVDNSSTLLSKLYQFSPFLLLIMQMLYLQNWS